MISRATSRDAQAMTELTLRSKSHWGYGTLLTHHFYERASAIGFREVVLDTDPHAEEFYDRLGFMKIGKLQSSIEHRFLPIMAKAIGALDLQQTK